MTEAAMDRFAQAGRLRLRYRQEGEGPDLVLVHGVGSRLDDWDGVVTALGGSFRTLRFDLRGHGQSDKPPGPYELEDFVADLESLVDALGIDRFHLAGFSLGGLIAQGFALAHPERLSSVMLISTVAGRTEEEKRRVMERLDVVANGIPGQHFENSLGRWFTDEFRRDNPDVIAAYSERNRQNDPAAYAAAYRVLATSDLADRLSGIRVPTLVATGEHDIGSNTRMARLMAERIANAKLHIFARLRHSILTEAPVEVARVMEEFLDGSQANNLHAG
jgi:pimeloyl-ACP methyl ester carboxylesterase